MKQLRIFLHRWVAIEYGGNDCNMPWADIANNPEGIYSPKVETSQFEKTLSDFVSAVRERGYARCW